MLFERSADASDSAVERSRSSFSAAILSCWLQLAVLLAALRLELRDLGLHVGEGLLHGGEGLQHLAVGGLAGLALALLDVLAFDDLAVLGTGSLDLLAESVGGRLERRELGAQPRLHLLLFGADARLLGRVGGVHAGDLGLVPRLDERRVFGDDDVTRHAATLVEEPRAEGAERDAGDEADDEQQNFHAMSVAAAADIDGPGARSVSIRASLLDRRGRGYCSAIGPCTARSSRTATGPIAPILTRVMWAS